MALLDLHIASPLRLSRPFRIALKTRLDLWRSRRQLAKLDRRALEDIGLSAESARNEAKRGIWDVPASWQNR